MFISFIEFQSPVPITDHYPNHNPKLFNASFSNFSNLSFISLEWRYTISKFLGKPQALEKKGEFLLLPIAISRQVLLPPLPKDTDSLQNLSSDYATALFSYCCHLSTFRSLSLYYLKILKAHLLSSPISHSHINFCDFSFYTDDSSNTLTSHILDFQPWPAFFAWPPSHTFMVMH